MKIIYITVVALLMSGFVEDSKAPQHHWKQLSSKVPLDSWYWLRLLLVPRRCDCEMVGGCVYVAYVGSAYSAKAECVDDSW